MTGPVAALLLFLGANVLALVANMLFLRMIADSNRKLPNDRQVSYFWMHPFALFEVLSIHRQLYPESRLRRAMWACALSGVGLMVAFALALSAVSVDGR